MTSTTAIKSSDPNSMSHGILRGNDWWEDADYPGKKRFRAEEEKAASRRGLSLEEFRELRYNGNRIVRTDTLALIADYQAGTLFESYANVLTRAVGENWMLIDQLPPYPGREKHSNIKA